jgi:tight adherence protein B
MSDDLQLTSALAAFAVLIFFGGLAAWQMRRTEARRLRHYVADRTHETEPDSSSAFKTPPAVGLVLDLNRRIERSSTAQHLELQLIRAGLKISPAHFILGQIALGSTLFLTGRYFLFADQGTLSLLLSLAAVIPAAVLPRLMLKFLQSRRQRRFEGQLAQAVDVMAGALQAGSSLPQAFEIVSREMPNPIGEEFKNLMQEAALAVPLEQALDNLLKRVPSMDLDMLVTAVKIQYRVGGNLSHILKTIAHTIRERVRIRAELNTLTAQARLSGYIISFLPIVVVGALMVLSPGYIMKLFDPGITRLMLISGVMGIIIGSYIMKRIATIEV